MKTKLLKSATFLLLVSLMWICNSNVASAQSSTMDGDKIVASDASKQVNIIPNDASKPGGFVSKDQTAQQNDVVSTDTKEQINAGVSQSNGTTKIDKVLASKPIPAADFTGDRGAQFKYWLTVFDKWYSTLSDPTQYLNQDEITMYKNHDVEKLFSYEMPGKEMPGKKN